MKRKCINCGSKNLTKSEISPDDFLICQDCNCTNIISRDDAAMKFRLRFNAK